MARSKHRIPSILSAIVLASLGSLPAAPPAKIKVMATIFPLQEFAQAVGEDHVEVGLLIPPGAEAHSWQPRASDIRLLAGELDLFLYAGPTLEPWAEDLIKNVSRPTLRVLQASRGLDLIENDPHVWLDFGQDLVIVDRIAAAFSELEPAAASIFSIRAEAYKTKLRTLDSRYAEALRPCRGRRILLGGHAAFGYLARRYGLIQTAASGASPDAEPGPKELARMISQAKAEGVKTVFYEPSEGGRLARTLAAEIGATTSLLYPGHNQPLSPNSGGATFLDLMDQNLRSLRDGLGCR